jgi:hypothetical protein
VSIVKTVTDKGDKAALLILDDGSKPIWTPDRELARSLVGKPIPADWIRKDGEYGPQAFPPKPKGQGRYRDTKEAFDREAGSRTAWQREEEDRKDRRTAVMTAAEHFGDRWPVVAEEMYEWLRSSPARSDEPQASAPAGDTTSPAAGPAEFPSRKASAGAASKGEGAGGSDSSPAGGTSSVVLGEATADREPGEENLSASGKTSPGFPNLPKNCSHKVDGEWAPTVTIGGQSRCSLCGLPAIRYRETA